MSISAKQLGDVIKIETTFGEQIIGELYCYEKADGLVVLRKKLENPDEFDMVLIKEQYIKSVEILKKGMMEDVILPPVSLSALHEKEKRMNEEMKTRRPPKTSPYGNYVFAHLSKFAACQWENDVILVDETVSIKEPYKMENVSGNDEEIVKTVKGWLELIQ